jgi:hypothetical protein
MLGFKSLYKPTITDLGIDNIVTLPIEDIPEQAIVRLPYKRKIGDRVFHARSLLIRDGNVVSELMTEGQFTNRPISRLSTPSTAGNTLKVSFRENLTYFTRAWQLTFNQIVMDPVGCKPGTILRIFHNDAAPPTFPASWVNIGTGVYVNDETNIIFVECIPALEPNPDANGACVAFEYAIVQ